MIYNFFLDFLEKFQGYLIHYTSTLAGADTLIILFVLYSLPL